MNSVSKIIRVKDVMKTGMDIVDGMQTVIDVVENLKYPENRAIIIDKRHDDDEYGIVMFRDIARKVMAPGRAPQRVNMYEIMSKPVISVDSDMDIRYCVRLFVQFGLSRAPVIDNRKIVGLVSYTDIVLKGMKLLQQ